MSPARSDVLDAVHAGDGPMSLTALSETTGLHVNTLRDHLRALLTAGLVRRERAAPEGRGRPAWLYLPAQRARRPAAEYAGLAAALAATIHRTSDDPTADAVAAGTEWGHELAGAAGGPAEPGDAAARRQVVAVLDRMGFAPQVDTTSDPGHTTARLTRCPLLDTARRYPDVVCGVHVGIARGALREYGADDSGVSLLPFAERDACVLHLATPFGR